MKKIFLLFALCAPCVLFGQLMDTTTIFYENFDGSTLQVTTSNDPDLGGGITGDWTIDPLHVSAPYSFHTPVYSHAGYSIVTTNAIPLTGNTVENVNHVYLSFDQICKVHVFDNATVSYSVANGTDNEGNYNWEQWKQLKFSSSSDFYLGEGAYTAGKFNDECYPIWNSSNMNAIPTNEWWRNELFDITDFVLTEGVTHFRLKFGCNKTSIVTSGTDACAGWYLDNLHLILSNCELVKPTITLKNPQYVGAGNNTLNNIGPYPITAKITDNDTVDLNTLLFVYSINHAPWDTVPNTIEQNTFSESGHTVHGAWTLPNICYGDTIVYKIYVQDTHGNEQLLETWLTAHHNYTNIKDNDCRLDSLNTFPYCFIAGQNQDVTLYFTNRSDPEHSISTGNAKQTALSVTLKVEDENHNITHNSTHTWTGSLCLDEQGMLSLSYFTPTRGFNYITVFINSRNNHPDGYHANDTLRYTGYACDSLLRGDYTVGGTNSDFADIADVKTTLLYCGLGGPVNFHLRPGTYQDFDFKEKYSGQSDVNTITFTGDNTDEVFIINNHTDAGNAVYGAVTLVGVQNYRFKNLTITGNDEPSSRGVVVRGDGSTDIIFDNCNITAKPVNTTTSTSCAVSRSTAAAPKPDTITFKNCTLSGGNYGIYYYGSNARKNEITIENCNITSCYTGIYTYYCNPHIKGNHIRQFINEQDDYQKFNGINVQYAIGADIDGNTIDDVRKAEQGIFLKYATQADFYIRNNHVKLANTKYGIRVENSSSTTAGNIITGRLFNNEVILYPVTATQTFAMFIKNSNGLHVNNNSLFIKSTALYSNTAAIRIENNDTTYLNNNLLINQCNNSDNTDYPVYLNGTSTIKGGYNDHVSTSGIVGFKSVARGSLAEWEDAITTTKNNISLLPPIAEPTDNLLPADFTGMECPLIPGITTDIRGIPRNGITYVGAYAVPIAPTDAAITALTNPISGTCPESAYAITVNIANKGSEVLNFSGHHGVLRVNSNALNLNRTVNINSGSIALLGATEKVIADNIAIPVNQNIDFTIIITTAGDANPLNDTLRTTLVLEAAIPDYEENFSHGTGQIWKIEQLEGAGNWSFQEGTGENPAITPVHGTGRLFFNSHTFNNTTVSRAIMPAVVLDNATNPILEMWMAQDRGYSSGTYSNLEGVTVKVSTDGGVTYSDLIPEGQTTALVQRYNSAAPNDGMWSLFTYNLSPYVANSCIHIAFDARSRKGNNINIDRIRLRNMFNNDIAISNIYAQGETPTQAGMKDVISARVHNEGWLEQSNIDIYLNVTGANEQYRDTITIASLASGADTLITFPDHLYNIAEVKNVEVRARHDEMNDNNAINWRMSVTPNVVNYADTAAVGLMTGDYDAVIRPCVRYRINRELTIKNVKYYYDATNIQNPEKGFRAFVSNGAGEIIATSDIISFNELQHGNWYTIPINNYALTNIENEFYVGIIMLANGNYLCSQVETPLRDSTFFYLESDGTYTPQTFGRFMIGAVVDTIYTRDLAIMELQHPLSDCDLGHEHITLKITNNGSDPIPPGTAIHYTVNNEAAVTQILQETIASHEVLSYVFNASYDFNNHSVSDVTYHIRAWVSGVAGDLLQYNDTIDVDIVSMGKSEPPIVPSVVQANYHSPCTIVPEFPAGITQGVFGWYTKTGFESWDFLGYNDTYTTPEIFFDTTYYVTFSPGYIFNTVVGTGTNPETKPFIFTSGYSRGRILYKQSEIGDYGTIASIELDVKKAATGENGIPIKIYVKESDLNIFPNTAAIDWETEKSGAKLVFNGRIFFSTTGWHKITFTTPFKYTSGNLVILTETNCADHCTGSGNQCNNCGKFVSGSTQYPSFMSTSTGNGFVQYKNGNTLPLSGNYSNANRRLNLRFNMVNIGCGSEKTPVHIHVPDIPTYDVQTDSLVYPTGGCALGDEHITVKITNLLNTPIMANKVVVHAVFNGEEITQTISEEIAPQEVKYITFDLPFDFSAPDSNKIFNYTVFTTLNSEPVVYRDNDTISGSFLSKYTYPVPTAISHTCGYTETDTVQPTELAVHYFYHNEDDDTPFKTGALWITPPLYDTLTLWVSAKTPTSGCETKRIRIDINVSTPQYDLVTNELVSPVSYQCGIANAPHIEVSVGNTDTVESAVIPAGTFQLTAQFTGTAAAAGTTVITEPVSAQQNSTITFSDGIEIGSNTQNNSYTYRIFSDPVDNTAGVYRGNDTIGGKLFIPANPLAPPPLSYTTNYGDTRTIIPNDNVLNYYYFYYNDTDNEQPFSEGDKFVTEPLYAANTTYFYSGRIEDNDFDTVFIAGNGTNKNPNPFVFNQGHSASIMLYTSDELGGIAGRIDSLYLNVKTTNNSGATIPVKMWLKNVPDIDRIPQEMQQLNWDTMKSSAQLILATDLGFDEEGWLGFCVPGGFDYAGGGLYILTEHNCGDASCVTTYGISPIPNFENSHSTKRVLQKTSNSEIDSVQNFSFKNLRANVKFKFNYTCESPKSPITITTTVPPHDAGVTKVITPASQNNDYTDNEQVNVVIKNFGTQSISNIPVYYQLQDNTAVEQTYSHTLSPGASDTVTFTSTIDLTSIYYATPLKAFTGLTDDDYHNNDTINMTVGKEAPCLSRPLTLATGADISNVTISNVNNGAGTPFLNYDPQPNNGMYTDYTFNVEPVNLVLGQTYPISITHSFTDTIPSQVYKRVFIDYNRDSDFDDADEKVFISGPISNAEADATTTSLIHVPLTADVGMTRMRVICATGKYDKPCGTYNYAGETEDYAVELIRPYQKDIGIKSYLHPVGKVCADAAGKIKIILKNFGVEELSFSNTTPLTLTAAVTGPVSATYSTTTTAGSLSAGEEIVIAMDNVDLSLPGTYYVTAQLNWDEDQYDCNDTMSTTASISPDPVISLPFIDNFDQNTGTDVLHFTQDWTLDYSAPNYKWKILQGPSPNNPDAGPTGDHTQAGTLLENYGRYASVPGSNSNYSTSNPAWTTLTSKCLNLHYKDGYPAEVNFYKHFFGKPNADFVMTVEVGSGEHFVVMDTLTKAGSSQTSCSSPWSYHNTTLTNYDEVGRVRFKVTKHKYKIDPSIDDLVIDHGLPDLAVISIQYPYDFRDEDHPDACLIYQDSVYPIVKIQNVGNSVISDYKIMCIAKNGNIFDTVTEHLTQVLYPGDTLSHTFENPITVPDRGHYLDLWAYALVDLDKNSGNDAKHVIVCTSTDIDDYDILSGVVLNQNVPNPTNGTTRISYLVPDYGTAVFSIHSTTGQLLYSESQEAMTGENHIDVNTGKFAAGIYYYTLQYKDVMLTRKMVVQK